MYIQYTLHSYVQCTNVYCMCVSVCTHDKGYKAPRQQSPWQNHRVYITTRLQGDNRLHWECQSVRCACIYTSVMQLQLLLMKPYQAQLCANLNPAKHTHLQLLSSSLQVHSLMQSAVDTCHTHTHTHTQSYYIHTYMQLMGLSAFTEAVMIGKPWQEASVVTWLSVCMYVFVSKYVRMHLRMYTVQIVRSRTSYACMHHFLHTNIRDSCTFSTY